MTAWTYDPDTRALVARRLWELLPSFYRVEDQPPRGTHELRRFLQVLAAPLALVRQNIEELHADLFVDSCGDDAIALLGALIGTRPLFPNADANRRDVRGTIAWRRRKGTPAMLEDMARELSDEFVVLHEGWQRVQISQDLDLLRLERVAPSVVSAIVAETSHGPLDRMHHAVDIRSISATTGKYHPRHLVHWRHPTRTWPVSEGTAAAHPVTGDEPRYTVHPLARPWGLLARSAGVEDPLDTDRIPAMHFATEPAAWFDRPGRFTVRVASLPAAVAAPKQEQRQATTVLAEHELAEGTVSLELLDRPRDRWTQEVEVALCVVGIDLGTNLADLGSVQVRRSISFDGGGSPTLSAANPDPVTTDDTALMIRLSSSPSSGCFFPGATLAITGGQASAALASQTSNLALRGYLRGALVVKLPATWVFGQRWFYLAADGSVVSAQSDPSVAVDVALIEDAGVRSLDLGHLAELGPGAAWPPLHPTTSVARIDRLPPTPGRGPVVMHGGSVVEAASSVAVGPASSSALEFAAARLDDGSFVYEPMVRLQWTGADPSLASWTALATNGSEAADLDARFGEIAQLREQGAAGLRLVVRFVSDQPGARMAPSEVAWSAHDGRTYLLYLPQLDASEDITPEWSSVAPYSDSSVIVEPADDGSTWLHGGGLGRMAEGSIAPLSGPVGHRRRSLRWRRLCPWNNESPGNLLAPPEPGFLDVDIDHGYFAFAQAEIPQSWPSGPASAPPPPAVTVDFEDGYSAHIGARPTSREIELDARLPTPTRLVTRSGSLARANDASLHAIPRYPTLAAALAAIDGSHELEVVQFEDSATYVGESLQWPTATTKLVIQAAEGHRPVIEFTSFIAPGALAYERLILRGIAWQGVDIEVPACEQLRLEWCSMTSADDRLLIDVGIGSDIRIDHCVCAGLEITGTATLVVRDSIIDAGKDSGNPAIVCDDAKLDIERCTVIGEVSAQVLEASEVLFNDLVTVDDRFRGCIRYSAVAPGSVLPRRHRVEDEHRPRFVSYDRLHPAHLRLSTSTAKTIRFGAEDGGEIGAFHELQLPQRREALIRRLDEYTPVGLVTGLVRVD